MQSLTKRIGYFLRDSSSGSKGSTGKFLIRYFLIDNNSNIYYTEHYGQLIHIIRKCSNLSDLFTFAESNLKRIKSSEFRASKVKKYDHPENLPFLNQYYFDVDVISSPDATDNSTLASSKVEESKRFLFFTFKDIHINLMYKFISEYDKQSRSNENENEPFEWPGIEYREEEKKVEKQQFDKLTSLDEHLTKVQIVIERVNEFEQKNINQDNVEKEQDTIEENGSSHLPSTLGVSRSKQYFNDDLSYVGEFYNGKRHGTGYFILSDKSGMCYVESINGQISGI